MPLLQSSRLPRILLVLGLAKCVHSMTYILLRGTGSNCVSVNPLPGSGLEIRYHLPDLKLKDEFDDETEEKEKINTEGLDKDEAALLERQRQVAIKRARQGKDVSIAVSQRANYPLDQDANKIQERPRNLREQPETREGTINFETSENGGAVQICVHSLFANKQGPYRVGLEINEKVNTTEEDAVTFNPNARALQVEATDTALVHLTGFSKEMIRAESLVRSILASADQVKKIESDHYEQSISMEKGVHMWPMIQISTILVAAVMQVRYILQYMKAKHIV